MFSFFHTIFIKITSAITGVVVAIGLVSAPPPQTPSLQTKATLETVGESKAKEAVITPKESKTQQHTEASQTAPVKQSAPQASEIKPATPPSSPTTQVSAPQVEVKAKEQPLVLTNATGQFFTFEDPIINKQRIQDLIDVGFSVTKGRIPDGIIFKSSIATPAPTPTATTTPQTKNVEISLVSAAPSLHSVIIEWQTNIPTNSKVFLSGGGFSSSVYGSESGLSTRHVVHISGLSSATSYSYELESIAGDQVEKKQGSFSTPDLSAISYYVVGVGTTTTRYPDANAPYGAWVYVVNAINSDGKSIREEFTWTASSGEQVLKNTWENYTGSSFTFFPKQAGIYTIVVSVPSLNKSLSFEEVVGIVGN